MSSVLNKHYSPGMEADHLLNPSPFYWPNYIWFWNDRLTRRVLRAQLADMKTCGVGSVWPLPIGRNFDSGMVSFLEPDYLTDKFLGVYAFMTKEARRLGMLVWLYDEGGYPSGTAYGQVVKSDPRLARQSVDRGIFRPRKGQGVMTPENSVVSFLYDKNGKLLRPLKPGCRATIPVDEARVEDFVIRQINRRDIATTNDARLLYPDLLNPATTRRFLQITHEWFKKRLKPYLGNTIPLVFTDEPSVFAYFYGNLPWTADLLSSFRKEKGYDLRKHLPQLFESDSDRGAEVRIDFFDWWSNRLAWAFFGQCRRWCHKNQLQFVGHLGGDGDDGIIQMRKRGYGHILRILREFDIPGVDTIWRQVFPFRKSPVMVNSTTWNSPFPKYASSVVHQQGKPWAMTESFCVYGAGLTPEQMKWVTDFQYVRGLNIMSVGSYLLSTRDYFMAGQRPMYGTSNPLWKYMRQYHSYVARMSYLLSAGKPVVPNAIYLPVRDVWAGGRHLRKTERSYENLCQQLLEHQRDYDLVDDDVLATSRSRIAKGRLEIGPMQYEAVCVPRCQWMSKESRGQLAKFIQAGGKVCWVDDRANTRKPKGVCDVTHGQVVRHLAPLVEMSPSNRMIRACKRQLSNGSLYFISNEDPHDREVHCQIRFTESESLMCIDPVAGTFYRPAGARYSGGVWTLPLQFRFAGSCVVFFSEEQFPLGPMPAEGGPTLLTIRRGWSLAKLTSYCIGKHDLEVRKERNWKPITTRLGDWRRQLGDDFSGDARYRVAFDCGAEVLEQATVLDLGKVGYACEVILNGRNLGKKLWQPFAFQIDGLLKKTHNELVVTVTNTMANQYVTSKAFDRWSTRELGTYHRIACEYEKESLTSGLFGPVRIQASASNMT